jgi:anti-anti-sigma factor
MEIVHPVDGAGPTLAHGSALLSIHAGRTGTQMTVSAGGEIDRCTSPALAEYLNGLLEPSACGPTAVTLDLAGVTFIDVSGLNVLLESTRRAAACGRLLRLARCSRRVVRLVRITGAGSALAMDTDHGDLIVNPDTTA